MIPRHQPAYTWKQWRQARNDRRPLSELESELGRKLCERLGRGHAIFYQRGRDAFFAFFSKIAPGSTAVVPAFTCVVVPEAIRNAGNPMVFADIDPATINMEPENLSARIEPRSVIVMTHQWGFPCRAAEMLDRAREANAVLFEDCAAAFGAEYDGRPCGSFGQVAVISFENTKLLGSGNLGVLLTDDDGIAARLREDQKGFMPAAACTARRTALLKAVNMNAVYKPVFRAWSRRQGDYYSDHGIAETHAPEYYRRRPDRFALALVLAQWGDLERRIEHRRRLMAIYREALGDEATCRIDSRAAACPIRQPIRVNEKRRFFEAMFRSGTDLGWSFDYAVAPPERKGEFPHAFEFASRVLNLPIHEGVSEGQARDIARRAKELVNG